MLRTYTAQLIGEIRYWLANSVVMESEPLPEWLEDPIAQEAIQACEDALAERHEVEGGELPNPELSGTPGDQSNHLLRTRPRVVQTWEALKSVRGIKAGIDERIPETDLRDIVGAEFSTSPENVTEVQIELAAIDLCRHYGTIRIVPSAVPGSGAPSPQSVMQIPIADATFWKERESEFRQHATEENKHLGATWFSDGSYWK